MMRIVATALLVLTVSLPLVTAAERPNIVVLFSDDDEAVIAGVMVGMSMSGKDEMREES